MTKTGLSALIRLSTPPVLRENVAAIQGAEHLAAHISSTVFGRTLRYRPISVTTPDGVAIAAQDWGREGSGRDVLMIHGFSQSHLCWLRQTDSSLADEFRLATYDNRGHGMSEKPATSPNMATARFPAS